ncbi:MAG: hypothetical protein WBG58_18115 [Ignavibacteriaceae bacterium]
MKSCFENKDIYVGIDVHKIRWVVTVRTTTIRNLLSPIRRLITRFRCHI